MLFLFLVFNKITKGLLRQFGTIFSNVASIGGYAHESRWTLTSSRVRISIVQTEAQAQDVFTVCRCQDSSSCSPKHELVVYGIFNHFVFDKVPKMAIVSTTNRCSKRYRFLGDFGFHGPWPCHIRSAFVPGVGLAPILEGDYAFTDKHWWFQPCGQGYE